MVRTVLLLRKLAVLTIATCLVFPLVAARSEEGVSSRLDGHDSVPGDPRVMRDEVARLVEGLYRGHLSGLYGLADAPSMASAISSSTDSVFAVVHAAESTASSRGVPEAPPVVTEDAVRQTLVGIGVLFDFCERDAASLDSADPQARAAGEANDGLDNVYGDTHRAGDPTCLMALTDFVGTTSQRGTMTASQFANSASNQALLWGLVEHYATLRHSDENVTVVFASVPELVKDLFVASFPPALTQANSAYQLCSNPQKTFDDPRTWGANPATTWCGTPAGLANGNDAATKRSPNATTDSSSYCQQESGDWQSPQPNPIVHSHNNDPDPSWWNPFPSDEFVNETDSIGMQWTLSKPDAGECYLALTCVNSATVTVDLRGTTGLLNEDPARPVPFTVRTALVASGSDSGSGFGSPASLAITKITEPRSADFPYPVHCQASVSPPLSTITWESDQYIENGGYHAALVLSSPDDVASSAGSLSPSDVSELAAEIALTMLAANIHVTWLKVLHFAGALNFGLRTVLGDSFSDYQEVGGQGEQASGVDFTNGWGLESGAHFIAPKGYGFRVLVTPTVTDAQQNGCNPCHGYLHIDAYSHVRFTAGVAPQEADACSCSGLTLPWTGYLWHRSVPFQVGFST